MNCMHEAGKTCLLNSSDVATSENFTEDFQDKAPQKWQQTAGLTLLSSAMLPPWTYLLQDPLPLKGFSSFMVNVPLVVPKII